MGHGENKQDHMSTSLGTFKMNLDTFQNRLKSWITENFTLNDFNLVEDKTILELLSKKVDLAIDVIHKAYFQTPNGKEYKVTITVWTCEKNRKILNTYLTDGDVFNHKTLKSAHDLLCFHKQKETPESNFFSVLLGKVLEEDMENKPEKKEEEQ